MYRKRGEIFQLIGDYPRAFDSFKRMEIAAEFIRDELLVAEARTKLGSIFLFKGDFDVAKKYFTELLKSFTASNNIKGEAICYKNLGMILQNYEEYEEAEINYKKAIELYRAIKDEDGEYDVLKHLAGNYRKIGKGDISLEIAQKMLAYYEMADNIGELLRCFQIIGNILCEQNDHENGIRHLLMAYDKANSIGDKLATIYILCDLGIGYYSIDNFSKACGYFEECLLMSIKCNVPYMQCIANLNLGDVLIKLNRIESAKSHLKKVIETKFEIPGIDSEATRLMNEIAIIERG